MFHWICPECGREIAPTVRECPVCDPSADTAELVHAGVVEAPARTAITNAPDALPPNAVPSNHMEAPALEPGIVPSAPVLKAAEHSTRPNGKNGHSRPFFLRKPFAAPTLPPLEERTAAAAPVAALESPVAASAAEGAPVAAEQREIHPPSEAKPQLEIEPQAEIKHQAESQPADPEATTAIPVVAEAPKQPDCVRRRLDCHRVGAIWHRHEARIHRIVLRTEENAKRINLIV
ncbi:MAG: hypothetical protein ABL967_18535 [Bryobacteraceae bacterium]